MLRKRRSLGFCSGSLVAGLIVHRPGSQFGRIGTLALVVPEGTDPPRFESGPMVEMTEVWPAIRGLITAAIDVRIQRPFTGRQRVATGVSPTLTGPEPRCRRTSRSVVDVVHIWKRPGVGSGGDKGRGTWWVPSRRRGSRWWS